MRRELKEAGWGSAEAGDARRHRIAVQKPTGSGKTAGKQYPILGKKAEITGEPGKEPHRQGERDEEIQVSWICVQQRERGPLYPCTPEITAESQEQAAGTHKEKSW